MPLSSLAWSRRKLDYSSFAACGGCSGEDLGLGYCCFFVSVVRRRKVELWGFRYLRCAGSSSVKSLVDVRYSSSVWSYDASLAVVAETQGQASEACWTTCWLQIFEY